MLFVSSNVSAVSNDVHISARFIEAINMLSVDPLNFSTVTVNSTLGAGDIVSLGTNNGTVSAGGMSIQSGGASAGALHFSSSPGAVIDISCNTFASLSNASGDSTINVTDIAWDFNNSSDAGGAAYRCDGLAQSVISTGSDRLSVGGTLNGATLQGALSYDVYSSSHPKGTPVTFNLSYN